MIDRMASGKGKNWEAFLQNRPEYGDKQLFIRKRDFIPTTDGHFLKSYSWITSITLETDPRTSHMYEPKAVMTADAYDDDNDIVDFLQAMVNLGSELGLIPTTQKDLSGELDSVRYHLEDLRELQGLKRNDKRV